MLMKKQICMFIDEDEDLLKKQRDRLELKVCDISLMIKEMYRENMRSVLGDSNQSGRRLFVAIQFCHPCAKKISRSQKKVTH